MTNPQIPSTVVFQNLCPNCGKGKIFTGFFKMAPTCEVCQYRYEKESGYFVGAMTINYTMGFLAILPPLLFLVLNDYSVFWIVFLPSVELICLSPFIFKYARLIWMYIDSKAEERYSK